MVAQLTCRRAGRLHLNGTDPWIDLAGRGPPEPGELGAVADPAPPDAARPHAAGPGGGQDLGGRGYRGGQGDCI